MVKSLIVLLYYGDDQRDDDEYTIDHQEALEELLLTFSTFTANEEAFKILTTQHAEAPHAVLDLINSNR